MGKNKAIIIDRDGTLNVDSGYVGSIDGFTYLDGAVEALKSLYQLGYLLIIVTNQSGIARGFFTEDQFKELNNWMLEDMRAKGIEISAVYYCPHLPEAAVGEYRRDCDCRKPKLGLFEKAIKDFDVSLDELYVIGDKKRDVAICSKYPSVHGIVLYSGKRAIEDNVLYIEGGLSEASKIIKGDVNG